MTTDRQHQIEQAQSAAKTWKDRANNLATLLAAYKRMRGEAVDLAGQVVLADGGERLIRGANEVSMTLELQEHELCKAIARLRSMAKETLEQAGLDA